MELTLFESDATTVRAGYSCSCGCTPSVEYARGAELAEEGCCCGNLFAVGPQAAARLTATPGFRPQLQTFDAPWGERLEAAWLIGPSVHGPTAGADGAHEDEHHHRAAAASAQAIDPVCGMTVEREAARAKGLHSTLRGSDYFFCGKGCKLEFDDEPEHYLDPAHVPSM